MVELLRYYVKETDTGITREVTLFDEKYISIDSVTFFEILKRSFRLLHAYCFKKNHVPKDDMFEAIKENAIPVFDSRNEILLEEESPNYINYQEIFDIEDDNADLTYIM